MKRLGLLAALALLAAAPARGAQDDAIYAQLRGDAGNLLNQARSLAFDGLTAAPNLLGQIQAVSTRLKALADNAEAQSLAGELSKLHDDLAGQAQGKDEKGFDSADAQRKAVQAFRAKSSEITSLAQRAMTLAQPNSAAWPPAGSVKPIPHAAAMAGNGSSTALPDATKIVQGDLGRYGLAANQPDTFDARFKGQPQYSPAELAGFNTAGGDPRLRDAVAQPPASAAEQALSRTPKPETRNDVLVQQRAINAVRRQQGLAAIPEDGKFGPRTEAAVCQFQLGRTCSRAELKNSGLGAIDPLTSDRLALRAAQAGDRAPRSAGRAADKADGPHNDVATIYYPGHGGTEGGKLTALSQPACTVEAYAQGRCDAVTAATHPIGPGRKSPMSHTGETIVSPQLEQAYQDYCAEQPGGCKNEQLRVVAGDRCPGCRPNKKWTGEHVDIAVQGPAASFFQNFSDKGHFIDINYEAADEP